MSSFVHPSPKGQALVEYSVILTIGAVLVIAAMVLFGPTLKNAYQTVVNDLQTALVAGGGSQSQNCDEQVSENSHDEHGDDEHGDDEQNCQQ